MLYHSLLVPYLPSGGINKAISGDGLFLHKHDKCYRVQKCKGNGLYLAHRINSKLVYFAKSDVSGGVALQGDRGPSGARCLKGDSGDKDPLEVEVHLESVVLKDLKVLLERLVKWACWMQRWNWSMW